MFGPCSICFSSRLRFPYLRQSRDSDSEPNTDFDLDLEAEACSPKKVKVNSPVQPNPLLATIGTKEKQWNQWDHKTFTNFKEGSSTSLHSCNSDSLPGLVETDSTHGDCDKEVMHPVELVEERPLLQGILDQLNDGDDDDDDDDDDEEDMQPVELFEEHPVLEWHLDQLNNETLSQFNKGNSISHSCDSQIPPGHLIIDDDEVMSPVEPVEAHPLLDWLKKRKRL